MQILPFNAGKKKLEYTQKQDIDMHCSIEAHTPTAQPHFPRVQLQQ